MDYISTLNRDHRIGIGTWMSNTRKDNGNSSVQPSRDNNGSSSSDHRVETARLVIASVIAFIWAAMYIRTFIDPKFNAPPELSIPMMAVVGWLYGSAAFKEIGRKNDN